MKEKSYNVLKWSHYWSCLDESEDLWFSDSPQITGIYCGVTEEQLFNKDYMLSIGLNQSLVS